MKRIEWNKENLKGKGDLLPNTIHEHTDSLESRDPNIHQCTGSTERIEKSRVSGGRIGATKGRVDGDAAPGTSGMEAGRRTTRDEHECSSESKGQTTGVPER